MSRSVNTETVDLLKSAGVTELAVANTDVAYSYTFLLDKRSFGLEIQLDVTSGTPDVKIELECGSSEPGTEGASDTDFVIAQALGGGTNPDCVIDSSCNTELVRFYPLPPVVAPFQRLKFTGQNSNPASAKVVRARVHMIQNQ